MAKDLFGFEAKYLTGIIAAAIDRDIENAGPIEATQGLEVAQTILNDLATVAHLPAAKRSVARL